MSVDGNSFFIFLLLFFSVCCLEDRVRRIVRLRKSKGFFFAKSSFSLVSFICSFSRYLSNYSVTPPSFSFLELFVP